MKKTIFKCALFMAMTISAATVVSCGDDNEKTGGGDNGTTTSKHIVKMVEEWYSSYENRKGEETHLFLYDSQGRIVEVDNGNRRIHYTYSDNTIRSMSTNENHTYTLSNGLIIRDDYSSYGDHGTINYTYDKDGYLINSSESVTEHGSIYARKVEWKNGNITKIYYDGDKNSRIYEYTNLPWQKNWFYELEGLSAVDKNLLPLGVWGKTPKNLPSKVVYNYYIDIYDYTIENGMITKMIHTWQSPYEFSTNTFYPIEWE